MLTPLDIENKVFKKTFGGYNREDVEDFLALILTDYEKLYRENIASKDRIETLTEAVNHYKAQEDTMQNAILAAQRAADGLEQNARESANNIIKEAKLQASELAQQARERMTATEQEYSELVRMVESYKLRVGAILSAQLKALDDIQIDRLPQKDQLYSIPEPMPVLPKQPQPMPQEQDKQVSFEETIRYNPAEINDIIEESEAG